MCTRNLPLLAKQLYWPPILPDPAWPFRRATRPDPHVVCPGFGFDRFPSFSPSVLPSFPFCLTLLFCLVLLYFLISVVLVCFFPFLLLLLFFVCPVLFHLFPPLCMISSFLHRSSSSFFQVLFPGHAKHEKGLQRQKGVVPLFGSQEQSELPVRLINH